MIRVTTWQQSEPTPRPIVALIRRYAQLLKFSLASLSAAALDFVIVLTLQHLTEKLLLAVVTARIISALFNYVTNKNLVFGHPQSGGEAHALLRYLGLVALVLAANYTLLHLLTLRWGLPLILAKLIVEIALFVTGYQIQKRLIFRKAETQRSR
jgi:putative flippase GtrA